uniref:POU domain protein n=1 Tax=Caenorhabditis japonica TaxID=281687 RepID=A0A8R1ICV5_CAEJA
MRILELQFNNSLFGSFDDPLLNARAAQVALADIDVKNVQQLTNPLMRPHDMFSYSNYFTTGIHDTSAAANIYQGLPSSSEPFDASVVVPTSSDDQMTPLQQVMAMQSYGAPPPFQYNMTHPFATSTISNSNTITRYPIAPPTSDLETDPRQLETFAEHFKQRRIKLGVTQADVGKALAHLKMPGVGSLSQSTICRFESLTLSHNNMVALKPILHSWLEKAEEAIKQKTPLETSMGSCRTRTRNANGPRIASIADRLDLKKNVVRVWFCNQRQKQKRDFRSQFRARSAAAVMGPRVMPSGNGNGSGSINSSGIGGLKPANAYNGLPAFFD